ncbi:MAG: hypothetical protein LC687_06545, partial [Actinobacteria bacterium]|nr:hypothetical protein [Actinomycetota bacterium]
MNSTPIHEGSETFIEHGTPNSKGHWRTLYIKWLSDINGTPIGVTADEVLEAVTQALRNDLEAETVAAVYLIQEAINILQNGLPEEALLQPADESELAQPD